MGRVWGISKKAGHRGPRCICIYHFFERIYVQQPLIKEAEMAKLDERRGCDNIDLTQYRHICEPSVSDAKFFTLKLTSKQAGKSFPLLGALAVWDAPDLLVGRRDTCGLDSRRV